MWRSVRSGPSAERSFEQCGHTLTLSKGFSGSAHLRLEAALVDGLGAALLRHALHSPSTCPGVLKLPQAHLRAARSAASWRRLMSRSSASAPTDLNVCAGQSTSVTSSPSSHISMQPMGSCPARSRVGKTVPPPLSTNATPMRSPDSAADGPRKRCAGAGSRCGWMNSSPDARKSARPTDLMLWPTMVAAVTLFKLKKPAPSAFGSPAQISCLMSSRESTSLIMSWDPSLEVKPVILHPTTLSSKYGRPVDALMFSRSRPKGNIAKGAEEQSAECLATSRGGII
mmetsp:Transcript_25267/g.83227  ORF Transcript_25267/g.83227 Transcript_25267/m.83227 type:complete len:284 (+) Transcript_25267:461-1312(+)